MAEGLLDQYREKLKKAIGTARFYGLPDRRLEKVFVELTVIEDFEIPHDFEYKALMDKELRRRRTLFPKDETEEDEKDNPKENDEENQRRPRKVRRTVKPEELLEAGKRSQVVGAPGCGKTTLLRWLALQTTKTSDRLPVFIELKALKKAQFDTIDDDFSEFLFQQGVRKRFDRTDLTADKFTSLETIFYEYYKAGRLVVLLDGLDEIAESERHRLRAAVENYANHHEGGLTLIVSTRPYGYLRNFADLKAMEIEPLSDIQIGQFLDHWCEKPTADNVKANLRKNLNFRSLARFPFLLAFIAHLNSAGDIPRIELYQRIVEQLIVEIDKEKGIERFKLDDPLGATKRDFLRKVAFDGLFRGDEKKLSNRLVFTRDEFLKAAKRFIRQENLQISPTYLVIDVCVTPLLREIEPHRYAFAHLTIQEFLAAEELLKRAECQKLFIKAFFNRQLTEMEVLPMTIGLADDPNRFYELLSKLPESFDFIRLCLEARSLGYHQKGVLNEFYRNWQVRLTDFGMGKIRIEGAFSNVVLTSFTGIETWHSQNLISGFLNGLKDQDWDVRRRATIAIGKLNNASPKVIAALILASLDQEPIVRQNSAEALALLGNPSPDVIHALSNVLRDQVGKVRQHAAEALGRLGNASPNIIHSLILGLRDHDWEMRRIAADALVQLGNSSPNVILALTDTLSDQNQDVRLRAADALVQLGNDSPDVILTLSDVLRDHSAKVRLRAISALGKLSNTTSEVIQMLSNLLRDQASWKVRQYAADALVQLSKASPNITYILSSMLHDQNRDARQSTAEVLARLGDTSPDVIHVLSEALSDPDPFVRMRAVTGFGDLGNTSPDIIHSLSETLRDPDSNVRRRSVETLVQLGSTSPDVIHTLTNTLGNRAWKMRQWAIEVIGKLNNAPPEVIPTLSVALLDQNSDVRQSAAEALVQFGNASPDVIRVLSDALRDKNRKVRQNAADALIRLGNSSLDVIRTLSDALRDQNREVRLRAADALVQLGIPTSNVILVLSDVLHDRGWKARLRAADLLERIGFDSPVFLEGLKLMLSDPDPELQKMALRSIGYPSTDPGLLDDLKKLMESENPEIREAAEDAYNKYKFKLEMLGLVPA